MTPNLPQQPDPRLIDSMCMRYDHSFAMRTPRLKDGKWDIETEEEFKNRQDGIRRVMRQLYEEVSGYGFYQYTKPTKQKTICLVLPAGDQCDLEYEVCRFIESLNIGTDETWGESYVLQGNILHGIQWSVHEGDCEIGCSWHENENYFQDENYRTE